MKRWFAIGLGPAMGLSALGVIAFTGWKRRRQQNAGNQGSGRAEEPRSTNMDWYQNAYDRSSKRS